MPAARLEGEHIMAERGTLVRHLYVHIPFCRSRCAYCDFVSESIGPHARAGRVQEYLAALRAELARKQDLFETPLETVYLGGGTPTALARGELLDLVRELGALLKPTLGGRRSTCSRPPALPAPVPSGVAPPVPRAVARPVPAPEFTVEANPGNLDAALLRDFAEAGVTRLSLGIQSFSPQSRAALGRLVTQEEIAGSLVALKEVAWPEWNLDLVFGIPGQTWPDVAADLAAACAAAPTHISLYDLTYTARYSHRLLARAGAEAREAAEAFAERWYAEAVYLLVEAGYERYEISNFALPGHGCRHNQAYWSGEDYVGLGVSAVSTAAGIRRTNASSVAAYLRGEPAAEEEIGAGKRMYEKAMLGLRTSEGVQEAEVLGVLDGGALERLLAQGCLERRYGKLRLNPGFMDVSTSIIAALLETQELA